MQEHVGKKRRKEVRQAANLRKQKNNAMIFIIVVMVIGMVLSTISSFLIVFGVIPVSNQFWTYVPTIIVFIVIFIAGSRVFKWTNLRQEYKDHCKKFNITVQDIREFNKSNDK